MNKEIIKNKLEEFLELKDNWDGYKSSSFNKEFIDKCMGFITGTDSFNLPQPDIIPFSGGIQFEWISGGKELEIEIQKDGKNIGFLQIFPNKKMKEGKINLENKEEVNYPFLKE